MAKLYEGIGILFFAIGCALLYADRIDQATISMITATFLALMAILETNHE